MSPKPTIKREYSAGGAVYKKFKVQRSRQKPAYLGRQAKFKIKWLVIKPKERDRWQLPKGWIDEGETGKTAAVREVAEEGGVRAEIIDRIDTISIFFHYSYGEAPGEAPKEFINKKITFFLMKFLGKTQKRPDPKEVEKVEWLPFNQAYEQLTFKSEKEILKKAKKMLEEKNSQPRLI